MKLRKSVSVQKHSVARVEHGKFIYQGYGVICYDIGQNSCEIRNDAVYEKLEWNTVVC